MKSRGVREPVERHLLKTCKKCHDRLRAFEINRKVKFSWSNERFGGNG